MEIVECIQGDAIWHAARAKAFTASETPAAMGVSKFKARSELLREKATGLVPDVDAGTQRRFDAGHAAEEAARGIVEEMLGEELFPCVGTFDVEGLPLLASFDGLNMAGDLVWETKLWSEELAEAIAGEDLAPHYWAQIECQLLVSGAEKAYFTASDGTEEKTVGMWYVSQPERRQQIIAAWKQFQADLFSYDPPEIIPAAVAAPQETLPAVSVQVTGSIAVIDNLTVFGDALMAYVERINRQPQTDQDFADLEATVKALKKAEDALDAAEANAMGQTASLDTLRRSVAQYRDLARANRLTVEKLVKAEKENRRNAIMQGGINALREHIDALNKRIGKSYMPDTQWANFPVAMKSLKTMASLQNAVDTELASAKINSSACADRIELNLKGFSALCGDTDYGFLFRDMPALVLKAPDDFAAVVTLRINEHKVAEDKRRADEREKIRAEEEAKAAAKIKAKQDELQCRLAEDAAAKIDANIVADRKAATTEPAIQPATVKATPSQEGVGQTVIAPTMTNGHLHDLIDEATRDMAIDELHAVLVFATAIRAGRQQRAA